MNSDQQNNPTDAVAGGAAAASSLSEHCDAVGSSRPAVIDNSDLIYDAASEESSGGGVEIHDTLLEGRDYVLLPHNVWSQLHTWYDGGFVLFLLLSLSCLLLYTENASLITTTIWYAVSFHRE